MTTNRTFLYYSIKVAFYQKSVYAQVKKNMWNNCSEIMNDNSGIEKLTPEYILVF